MQWVGYKLVFRLLSPLHIGDRIIGNLQSTRPYVPGKVLWAALTARMTRDQGLGQHGSAYQNIGGLLHCSMRFGYLWPSLDEDGGTVSYPWELCSDFDYKFLGSYMSTALDYTIHSAADGSLHEAEFLAPYTRKGRRVYLSGWLWVQKEFDQANWKDSLKNILLGGERRYGWGRVRPIKVDEKLHPRINNQPDRFQWSGRVPAHLIAAETKTIQGEVEPLLGWETSKKGGKELSNQAKIAFRPGCQLNEEKTIRIGEYGVWEVCN
jgi:hypothetical protein